MNNEEVLNKLVEWINKTIIKPMASSPNDDLSEKEIAQIKEILSQSSELEEVRNLVETQKEVIIQYQDAILEDGKKIEQLQSELADTRLERDNYFDELHAKRQELASVKSELEKVKGEREAEGYEFMRVSTDNKRLRDVVEGIKESLFELNNDTSFEFVIGKVYESIKLISSLEGGGE